MNKAFPRHHTAAACASNKKTVWGQVLDVTISRKSMMPHGPPRWDMATKRPLQRLQDNLRPQTCWFATSGEEFAVLLARPIWPTHMVAKRLRTRSRDLKFVRARLRYAPPCRFGITMTQDTDDLDHLIHEADQAPYLAKQNGGEPH